VSDGSTRTMPALQGWRVLVVVVHEQTGLCGQQPLLPESVSLRSKGELRPQPHLTKSLLATRAPWRPIRLTLQRPSTVGLHVRGQPTIPTSYKNFQIRPLGRVVLQGKCGGLIKAHMSHLTPCHLANMNPPST
jgi:hypothetical protein